MLGDIAIWRTNTAAEAQHALHFVCVCMGGGGHSCRSLLFWCSTLYSAHSLSFFILNGISVEMIIFHLLSFSHIENRPEFIHFSPHSDV